MQDNQIPVATTATLPPYYRLNTFDKNGVFNGIRDYDFVPSKNLAGLCNGHKDCQDNPDSCLFLTKYYEQISQLDKGDVFAKFEKIIEKVEELKGSKINNPEIVLIVYEAYISKSGKINKCSEAWGIKKLFENKFNYKLEDFGYKTVEQEQVEIEKRKFLEENDFGF